MPATAPPLDIEPASAPTDDSHKLNVAIIGGGIGGLCLAIGLLSHPHLSIKIYEAAPAFSEIGAGVACGANAARALSLIDLSGALTRAYSKCATHDALPGREDIWFPMRHGQVGQGGEEVGSEIWTIRNQRAKELGMDGAGRARSCLHRADFLKELVELIPGGVAEFGKAFTGFEVLDVDGGKGVRIHFADGTDTTADVVVGCDGIKSGVRTAMLKNTGRTVQPSYTGVYAYRALVPVAAAKQVLPEELAICGSIYCGYGSYSTNYLVSKGEFLNVIIICKDSSASGEPEGGKLWPHKQWQAPATKEKMLEDLQGWYPGLLELMVRYSNYSQWALFDLPHDESYVHPSGLIALMGDGAHAATPHCGAGASQAIEDAFVLSRLLGQVKQTEQMGAALRAYDAVRRPRSQKLVRYSAKAMGMYTKVKDDTEETREARREIEEMYRWIWDEDLEAEAEEAQRIMRKELETDPT